MIFDTDILIWYFRNNGNAVKLLSENAPFSITAVTYMEIMQGALNKQELMKLQKILKDSDTKILPITERITYRAMNYVDNYALSNSMELADALNAAICIENDELFFTSNDKHYKCVPNLKISVFRP